MNGARSHHLRIGHYQQVVVRPSNSQSTVTLDNTLGPSALRGEIISIEVERHGIPRKRSR